MEVGLGARELPRWGAWERGTEGATSSGASERKAVRAPSEGTTPDRRTTLGCSPNAELEARDEGRASSNVRDFLGSVFI
jgi:hypothetical protein